MPSPPDAHPPENLLTEWSRLVIGTLVERGIRDVVISPGSRSTPFVWACLEHPELRCHSVIDERAAGFFALGIARQGNVPLLLCTSGTAAAHYYPAVIEAKQAGLPLLLLTADRPRKLQDSGAAQTIDQTRLFGNYADSLDLGDPSPELDALSALVRKVAQGVARATLLPPRPVQLNAPADKPLEPKKATSERERALRDAVTRELTHVPLTIGQSGSPAPEGLRLLVLALEKATLPLFIFSGLSTEEALLGRRVLELTEALAFGEASANCGAASPPEFLIGHLATLPTPDLIVRVGGAPTSNALATYLATTDTRQVILSPSPEVDPEHRATLHIQASVSETLRALAAHFSPSDRRENLEPWKARRATLRLVLQRQLEEERKVDARGAAAPLSEPLAVAEVLRGLPPQRPVLLGNSLTLRLVDWVLDAVFDDDEPRPHFQTQRGANGIDGLIAGAQGARSVSKEGAALLLGDVSAAHDLTSLALGRDLTQPLVVIVFDNEGGHLFDHLPMRAQVAEEARWRFWETPPRIDFESAARAFGASYIAPTRLETVAAAVGDAFKRPGVTVIHVKTDPARTKPFLASIRGARS